MELTGIVHHMSSEIGDTGNEPDSGAEGGLNVNQRGQDKNSHTRHSKPLANGTETGRAWIWRPDFSFSLDKEH